MGAYLSMPVTDTVSEDGESDRVMFGASSMQGWRVSQEDSHSAITDYDDGSDFFAVFDGHGGAEVAQYSAQHLHKVIKSQPSFANGEIMNALEEAFLQFDASLIQKDVVEHLKILAGTDDLDVVNDDEEEKETNLLIEEADMPIEDLINRYNSAGANISKPSSTSDSDPADKPSSSKGKSCFPPHLRAEMIGRSKKLLSPFLKARQNNADKKDEIGQLCYSSSAISTSSKIMEDGESLNGEHKDVLQPDSTIDSDKKSAEKSDLDKVEKVEENENNEIATTTSSNDCHPSSSSSSNEATSEVESSGENLKKSEEKIEEQAKVESTDVSESSIESSKGKGKQKKIIVPKRKPVPVTEENEEPIYKSFLNDFEDNSEDDSDDSSDEYEGAPSSDEDEDDVEDDEEEESSEDSDEEEEENDVIIGGYEEPGRDSGCTAIVALLRGNCLYVANAGDSRCVVSRKGIAHDMSFDHKPEDEPEKIRIEKAGGQVTQDGRVNNGLNLSRAIGDHAYKDNPSLSAKEQMITALPDIKTLKLESGDDFMVLACDGIWNSMSSQQVVDFVEGRLNNDKQLSKICEEMFNYCLAPNTMGDGTGCDNMTCIIVKFKNLTKRKNFENNEVESATESVTETNGDGVTVKKLKTDDNVLEADSSLKVNDC